MKLKLEQSNHKYKENANKFRRHHIFEGGDKVMVHLKKCRFSSKAYNKLNTYWIRELVKSQEEKTTMNFW